ncbi:TIGR03085 family metal-binding protein [Mycolicibacterium baixiangningiae]|uniref:TIGR03085 family metal-binding protein n=1 Tax=Mycolicibacterium baixiangningiae TaxID=2761578 RepID=UPI0018D13090|nr:TIGR03085 family metal-binding protein [Mycolicibacterium baixiangningiae]
MTAAQRERAAVVDAMRAQGPDAPTLCEGWKTRDLAAHLYIREYRPDATAGIMVPALAKYTAKVQDRTAEATDWNAMLDKIASGPPRFSPFKLLDPVANLAEMFIHCEDVRRAQPGWEPRTLDDATVKGLTRTLSLMSRLTLAKAPARTALRTPEGKTLVTAGKGDPVTVTGRPEELLLFAVGREARVDFEGDPAAVQALRDAPKGL